MSNAPAAGMRALVALARIIGKNHGLNVVFDPHERTASTNGKTVTLPVISNLGTEDHAVLIEGLLDHEAMHCRLTDFEVLRKEKGSALLFALQNIFEDVWGEREQARIYPGCARNIKKAMLVMMQMGWFREPAQPLGHPAHVLINFLLMQLRARWFDLPDLSQFAQAHRAAAEELVGQELVDRLLSIALKVDDVRSTKQAFALAREIVSMLEQEDVLQKQKRQPPPPPPSPSQSDQPEQSKEETGGSSGPQEENEGQSEQQPDHADGDPDGDAAAQEGGDDVEQGGASSAAASSPSDADSDSSDVFDDILSAAQEDIGTTEMADRILGALNQERKAGDDADSQEHALSQSTDDPFEEVPPTLVNESQTNGADQAVLDIARPICIKLGTRLERLLETLTECSISPRRRGNRMMSSKVPGLRFGKMQAFIAKEDGQGIDTAVAFLIDGSQSMWLNFAGNSRATSNLMLSRIASAGGIVYAAAQVLEKHQIPFATYCFGSHLSEVKSFESRWSTAKHYSLTRCLGYTSTDLAVLKVTDRMIARPEARRIIVIVTDGCPDDSQATVAAMNEARRFNVQFAVVIVGSDEYVETFRRDLNDAGYEVASALSQEELSTAVFKAIEKAF